MTVAIYCRVSTDEQAERGTIENQIEFSRKYCDLHEIDIYKIYREDGISGTVPLNERPEGKQLIDDAKEGKYTTLLLYKLDRLGRSARITLNSIAELEGYGIEIKSMTEPFDTSNPSGRFMITMLAGVADLERETILERLWQGANRAARNGKWLGGIVPYGYIVDEDRFLQVDEEIIPKINMSAADVIRLMYSRLYNGESCFKVADYFNAIGIPTNYIKNNIMGKRKEKTSGIWTPARIRNMIVNTTYKGIHIYGKRSKKERELIEREVPAIVSIEVWEKAQQTLKDNYIDAFRTKKYEYLLTSLIKCKLCGCTYIGTYFPSYKTKDGKRIKKSYYVCGGKQIYKGRFVGKCTSKNIPTLKLEEIVWNDVCNYIANPGEVISKLKSSSKNVYEEIDFTKKSIESLKLSIHAKEEEKQSILDLFRKKIISSKDVEDQLSKINLESENITSVIKSEEMKLENYNDDNQNYDSIYSLLTELNNKISDEITFQDKKKIVKKLVDKILVDTIVDCNGKESIVADIKYNFPFLNAEVDICNVANADFLDI